MDLNLCIIEYAVLVQTPQKNSKLRENGKKWKEMERKWKEGPM